MGKKMKKSFGVAVKLIIGFILLLIVALSAFGIYMAIPVKENNVPGYTSEKILKDLGIKNFHGAQITEYLYRRWNELTLKIEDVDDCEAFFHEFFEAHDYSDDEISKSEVAELDRLIKSLENPQVHSEKYRNMDGDFVNGYRFLCPDDSSLLIYRIDDQYIIEVNYFLNDKQVIGK